jgi:hypothetical protein
LNRIMHFASRDTGISLSHAVCMNMCAEAISVQPVYDSYFFN